MEWKLIRGRERKNLHAAHHVCLEGKHIHGTRLPCTGIHACQSPPIVVLGNGGPGHRCACPPAPSASHWRSSICWRPAPIVLLRIGNRQSAVNRRSTSFLSLVNFCMVFATAFPLHLHTLYVFKECLPATSV